MLCTLWKAYYYASDETDKALGNRFAWALVAAVDLPDWVDDDGKHVDEDEDEVAEMDEARRELRRQWRASVKPAAKAASTFAALHSITINEPPPKPKAKAGAGAGARGATHGARTGDTLLLEIVMRSLRWAYEQSAAALRDDRGAWLDATMPPLLSACSADTAVQIKDHIESLKETLEEQHGAELVLPLCARFEAALTDATKAKGKAVGKAKGGGEVVGTAKRGAVPGAIAKRAGVKNHATAERQEPKPSQRPAQRAQPGRLEEDEEEDEEDEDEEVEEDEEDEDEEDEDDEDEDEADKDEDEDDGVSADLGADEDELEAARLSSSLFERGVTLAKSAYEFYEHWLAKESAEVDVELKTPVSWTELRKATKAKWHEMNEEEKAPFFEQEAESKATFLRERAAYEAAGGDAARDAKELDKILSQMDALQAKLAAKLAAKREALEKRRLKLEARARARSASRRKQWTQLEDDTVRALVHQHGTRAWATVALSLPGRTRKRCQWRWLYHLDHDINKSAWSLDEDRKLMQLHDEFGNKWVDIAKYLPGRPDNAVRTHWNLTLRRGENIAHMLVDGQLPKGFPEGRPSLPGQMKQGTQLEGAHQWTQLEDDTVRALVHQHGTRAWATVALSLPGRTGRRCRERWLYHLDHDINKSAWSLDEDRKLMQLHDEFGNKWVDIAKYLPGRHDNAVSNRWNSALRRGENIAHMLVDGQLPKGFPEGLPSLPGTEPSRTMGTPGEGGAGCSRAPPAGGEGGAGDGRAPPVCSQWTPAARAAAALWG